MLFELIVGENMGGSIRLNDSFFMHPKPEMDLSSLGNCIYDQNPKSFDDITAGQFLEERLKDIGLKK